MIAAAAIATSRAAARRCFWAVGGAARACARGGAAGAWAVALRGGPGVPYRGPRRALNVRG